MPLLFGEFALDQEQRQLLRTGQPVSLEPKAYELLSLLVERRPRALSRAQIRDVVWPATFVSESTLAVVVNAIRQALADDARKPRFIRTVRGFGYAFIGEAREAEAATEPQPPAACRLRHGPDGSYEVTLRAGENVMGRVPEAVVTLTSDLASRRHARIVVGDDRAVLEDLGSKNGTFLNGARVDGPTPLQDGDEITIGRRSFVFCAASPTRPTRTDRTGGSRSAGSAARHLAAGRKGRV
jgi:DNA-binding winged helix-turn-helix (wHTH) protein